MFPLQGPEEDQFSPVVARASEAMWFFSTVLIVIVGLLVALGTIFQVKWDRERRRPRLHRGTAHDHLYMLIVMFRMLSCSSTDSIVTHNCI